MKEAIHGFIESSSFLMTSSVMVTSFVKIAVVLSILRSAVGTPQIPPAIVINGLALILTAYSS